MQKHSVYSPRYPLNTGSIFLLRSYNCCCSEFHSKFIYNIVSLNGDYFKEEREIFSYFSQRLSKQQISARSGTAAFTAQIAEIRLSHHIQSIFCVTGEKHSFKDSYIRLA
nr:MAG TPA: hypothetical protein [Caudoviricetes sp.]